MQTVQPTNTLQPINTAQPMSLTGFVILILGLLTLTPEIYISGIMVMLISVSLQIKYFEGQRIQENIVPINVSQEATSAEAFYAW